MSIFDRILGGGSKAIESSSDQSMDEQKLAAFVKSKVESARSAANRIAHEAQWMTNSAYLIGIDGVFYDSNLRQFRSMNSATPFGVQRNRIQENLILPAVQNRQARLCKSPPKWELIPKDNTNEAKEQARLAYEVLLQTWEEARVNVKRLELTMWLQQCGHAYFKVSFDDQAGKELIDPVTGKFMGYEGCIRVDPVSAFEVFPDPLAKTFDDAQYITQAQVRKLDYFKAHFPERGHLVKEEGAWLNSIQYEQRIQTMTAGGPNGTGTQIAMENAAIELNYYEKRSRKHPKGRHIIVANGVVLKDDVLPVGEIPFAKFDDVLIAGKYYSEATITHARPLQDQYNRVLNKRSKWVNRLLAGKYIAARGHGLHEESLDDESGEVLEFDPVQGASEPHSIQAPSMPQYAYQETEQLKSGLFQIFGLSEVSRGQLPSAAIPAVGMQLLVEQDETRIGIEVEQHEHSYARTGQLMLMYAARYYKTPRNLLKRGITGDIQVEEYTGDKLPMDPMVVVKRGSTIPTSLSMRRQEIVNAYNMGFLGDPADPEVRESVMEKMEFGDNQGLWKSSALLQGQVKRIIDSILAGEIPEIHKADNHPYIIKKLNDLRISDKGAELDPERKALLDYVMEEHLKMATDMANPELQQMEANVDQGLMPEGVPIDDGSGIAPEEEMPQDNTQPGVI